MIKKLNNEFNKIYFTLENKYRSIENTDRETILEFYRDWILNSKDPKTNFETIKGFVNQTQIEDLEDETKQYLSILKEAIEKSNPAI